MMAEHSTCPAELEAEPETVPFLLRFDPEGGADSFGGTNRGGCFNKPVKLAARKIQSLVLDADDSEASFEQLLTKPSQATGSSVP
jgi:hypothetical protein